LEVHPPRFENELVDEINLFTFPVVVGQGTRLFPDTGRGRALELVESRATPSGVTIQLTGPPGARSMQPRLEARDVGAAVSERRSDVYLAVIAFATRSISSTSSFSSSHWDTRS